MTPGGSVETGAIANACPPSSVLSVAGVSATVVKPHPGRNNPSAPIQGKIKLICAYGVTLPQSGNGAQGLIQVVSASYDNAALAFATLAKLGECAAPRRPAICTTHLDPGLTEYTQRSDEVDSIEVDQPLGSLSASFGATPTTRLAGYAITVRNGEYVCIAVSDVKSEDATALQALGHGVVRVVEQLCGR